MSFLSKIGQDMEKDRKLVILRKKYFHDILQFNQKQQQKKKEDAQKEKFQSNTKILRMNREALEALQSQQIQRLQEKIGTQSQLKQQYERQIREKRQIRRQEKQIDKTYLKLQQIQTDKASERRLQDLLKIYERVEPSATHRRIKTEVLKEMDNPQSERKEFGVKSRRNINPLGFLPPIQKSVATLQQKQQNPLRSGGSGKSVSSFSKRTLF